MLRELEIHNLAIIDTVQLEFTPGLTVLTGETGAGKSILVGALGLLLGDRADAGAVRDNTDKAEVHSILDCPRDNGVTERLAALDIDVRGGELLLRRSVRPDGRSRAWVNGSPVPVQVLRELGESLVDIQGQHSHQALLRGETQRRLLDEFGDHQALCDALHRTCLDWRTADVALARHNHNESGDQTELLRYQLEELHTLAPGADEYPELLAVHRRLSNAVHITDTLQGARTALEGDQPSLQDGLSSVYQRLTGIIEFEPALQPVQELLDSALIQLQEAGATLRELSERPDMEPERLAQIEERLSTWYAIARKHKVPEAELYAHQQILAERLSGLEGAATRRAHFVQQRREALDKWCEMARQLHAARCACAGKFAEAVTEWMQQLGMPGGQFQVEINPMTGMENTERLTPTAHGMDTLRFLVSTNPGQPLRPLHRVASGGELSRISLAVQIIGCEYQGTPVLICDEVDAGIGGDTAVRVGELLAQLARHRQILCVSHLPQIAACASHHYHVQKQQRSGRTSVAVHQLDGEPRVQELARMLGGSRAGTAGLEHARTLLKKTTPPLD